MSFEGENHNDPPGSYHRNLFIVNSNIMLTVTASLSLVVIFVILFHVYARCVLRRQPRRRSITRSLDPVNYQLHYTEPPPPPPPQSSKAGLDPTVISALPRFVFKQTDGQNHDRHDHECAVCLSNIEGEEMARLLPNCKHVFHADCIDIWLASQSTCPICRTEAAPRLLQPESREGPVTVFICSEAASSSSNINNNGNVVEASSAKLVTESSSRLSSFRRILSGEWERSSTRHHQDDINHDLER